MDTAARGELSPVRNRVERLFLTWFFVIIPVIYVLRLAVQYAAYGELPYALGDTVKIASEVALLILFTFANSFLVTVAQALKALFSNGVVAHSTEDDREISILQAASERALDRQLNHGARVVFAGALALVSFYYYETRLGGWSALAPGLSVLRAFDLLLYSLPTVGYTYFVGIVFWKLFASSLFFQSFPERYRVIPRVLHPDGACGCLPIGDLCVSMMQVAVAPTVLSALLLIAYLVPRGFLGYFTANRTLLTGFIPLILGAGVVGLMMGFLPLFKFHLSIMSHRQQWSEQLHGLAERIVAERVKVLNPADAADDTSLDAVTKRIAQLQSQYETLRKIPLWPTDGRLVARIWASVGVIGAQLLGFIETVRRFS